MATQPYYEALIEKRRGMRDEMGHRKQASKLADAARNLETLHDLAEAQEKEHAQEAPPMAPAPEQAEK
jgi:hypothetical protein